MADFSGYATRANVLCSDGRIISPEAFKHQHGQKVPLVWMHQHDQVSNVLGHALLEYRPGDGIYCYGDFNDTPGGKNGKELVLSGDIDSLSIYANQLKHDGNVVQYGQIREVSLVLTGANPGASIDTINIRHSSDEGESAIIYSGEELYHTGDEGRMSVYDTMTDEQKSFVNDLIDERVAEEVDAALAEFGYSMDYDEDDYDEDDYDEDDYDEDEENFEHSDFGGSMSRNVFMNSSGARYEDTLSHSDVKAIFEDARKSKGSLKESFLAHTEDYGISDIEILFPDHHKLNPNPHLISRKMGWVGKVMSSVQNSPFSFVKTIAADITDEALRAKGYVKGNRKKEDVIKLLRRKTGPVTVYKKQRLDRDDELDIKDFDVLGLVKAQMRVLLDEEIAKAILVGDGRPVEHEDKIDDEHIRPIWTDNDLFSRKVILNNGVDVAQFVKEVVRAHKYYKGSGRPSLFLSEDLLTDMMLLEDKNGRRIYETEEKLAAALRVTELIPVEAFEGLTRNISGKGDLKLKAIMVNLSDYTVGAHEGGKTTMFEDFDLDYNQRKFLLEARLSGALTKPFSAIVFEEKSSGFSGNYETDIKSAYPPYKDDVKVETAHDKAYAAAKKSAEEGSEDRGSH